MAKHIKVQLDDGSAPPRMMIFNDAEYAVNNDDTLQVQQNGELVGWFPKGSYHHFTVENAR